MKEKLYNGCINLVVILLPFAMVWGAVTLFKNGEYIKGGLCVLGALLFGLPIIGLFSKSKDIKKDNPSVPQIPLPTTKKELIKVAKRITCNDKDIMNVVLQSLESPKDFCQMEIKAASEKKYDYQQLLDWYEEEKSITNLKKIVMLYAIGNSNYVAGFDWKDDLETFLWKMKELQCLKQHNLPINDSSLTSDGDISQWCLLINEQWKPLGFQIIFIDADSDEYWVTIVPITNDIE
ncbi:DUF6630 family protein [Prevotella aurantiaca]|uniref:DUF6630 family protein n=1 Tax=Prevotella aurantiaca TaxID=596085 RepID=UPI0028DBD853|nr:DUF6630 family protein [Prevotella aurantiaca]